jgi:phosphatidylglycerol:prolipoprotein diacylglycerol transferase
MIRQVDSRKDQITEKPDLMIAPVGIIAGAIGAKLIHVLEQLDYYIQNPRLIFSGGGLAIYGGVLGATLGIWIYLKVTHQEDGIKHFGFFVDLVAPAILLAQAIGRVGCLVNGCCHGAQAPDWLPFSIMYTNPNTDCALPGVAVYPTQLYEIIFCLVAFFVLLRIRKRLEPMEGAVFLIYLILYSAWRLGIGFVRADQMIASGLSQSQIISIVVLVIAGDLLRRIRRKHLADQKEGGSGEDTTTPAAPPDD